MSSLCVCRTEARKGQIVWWTFGVLLSVGLWLQLESILNFSELWILFFLYYYDWLEWKLGTSDREKIPQFLSHRFVAVTCHSSLSCWILDQSISSTLVVIVKLNICYFDICHAVSPMADEMKYFIDGGRPEEHTTVIVCIDEQMEFETFPTYQS